MISKSKIIIFAVGSMLAALTVGCGNRNRNADEEVARELYRKSLTIARQYTDSMSAAKDSVEVARLEKGFDSAMTRLSLEYPVDTHLNISQGENDTLTNVTLRYVALRDSLLHAFAHHKAVEPDSISSQEPTP